MKQLFFICHESETVVQAGTEVSGIPNLEAERLAAVNAFLTLNINKSITAVWDDDDEFEEILDLYTFITVEDARNSIYNNKAIGD